MEELWNRYSRQMLFKPIGEQGQQKIAASKILIVGMGALGTVAANHLVRSGVGHVMFCDRDFVEMSNLQRQTLFDENDVKNFMPKAVAAESKLKAVNSDVIVEGVVTDITSKNIETYLKDVDMIIDGTDNFQTRYLMNDAAYKHGIPYVYGGAVSSRGMHAVFVPGKTPCLRCLFPSHGATGQTCDTVGVLSPLIDMVASMESLAVLKYLSGNQEQIDDQLLTFDLWRNDHFSMKFGEADEACPTCGTQQYPDLTGGSADEAAVLCGRDTVQLSHTEGFDLKKRRESLEPITAHVKETPFLIRVQLHEGETLVLFPDGRTLVQGTEDIGRAKTLYSKYVGN
ncbi:ThiF family adenylyltransferase [Salisediminibacterium halotolerans]|uniref:Adenylyltransferase and sulfurtransferase n=1 Tax=Salisediminibacterium halotolerans TaxID=517425 RepID=A0A1H9SAE9_9BACI|nr:MULTISPECIES: ThiF family adenylyltransferase [Salisediminibacterium]RLJ78111.1 adenylyltransferase/sulfurtransferase [Actinophytocola xinjiangensis]RPE88550.1 adenylyltransferase/sulfurtransferase [Salisediminibacterium halotolerans]TWG37088.1 adenylyltransferase/sulfurtransferase [Salisediminibacterium halotolerans]SER81898.1 adenylyltransferase and sulfurtransferase [Salisediminibacterium haloalkalitolerans]GEL09035.1 thiazole biosynthesis adenylyltransferase ThiF [Salisediminibacterium 